MKHFAHYIKRTVVEAAGQSCSPDPSYAEPQSADQGFRSPAYHSVPTNSGVASRVKAGDTIWLFSQLDSPWGTLVPSLDAMIRVSKIEKSDRSPSRYRFSAADESKWYPLFNANELISNLKAIDAANEVRDLLNSTRTAIGQALQFLRETSDPSPLLTHEAEVSGMKPDFISYRMIDGTKSAFELAKVLLEKNRSVFWDRWSLPRRLAERAEHVGPEALDSHIGETIANARAVWGALSPLYAIDGSYSKLEKELAIGMGKFRPYPQRDDG